MKKWPVVSALLFVFGVFGFSVTDAAENAAAESSVLEVSITVSGEPVISGALMEVVHGTPARVSAFDSEARATGFEVELEANALPAAIAAAGTLAKVHVWRIEDGQRSLLADAEVGVVSGKPASVRLSDDHTPVLLEIKLHGQHAVSAEELAQAKANQCADAGTSTDASASNDGCCTRKCSDGSYSWMQCCGAIYCCACGVCCVTP